MRGGWGGRVGGDFISTRAVNQYLVPSTDCRVPSKEIHIAMTSVSPGEPRDLFFYLLAALAGAGIGWVDVVVKDLLFTALLVLMGLHGSRPAAAEVAVAVGGCSRNLHSFG